MYGVLYVSITWSKWLLRFTQQVNICSGNAFVVSPTNNAPSEIIPLNTVYSWTVPTVTASITGGSAMANQVNISQVLTNNSNTIETATYTFTLT